MATVNTKQLKADTGAGLFSLLQDLDTRSFLALLTHPRSRTLTRAALIVSFTADGWFYTLLLPLILLMVPEQSSEYLLLALSAFGMERLLYFSFKNTIRRRRPPAAIEGFQSVIMASDRFSLPSGHTSAAFLFVTFLCVGLSWYFAPLYLWALAVACSRVLLGVHFPIDTVLGALLGISVALLVL